MASTLQNLLEKLLGSSWQSERNKQPSTDKLASLLKGAGLIDVLPHLSPGERRDLIRVLTHRDAVLWMEHNFHIPEPRDPVLGTIINTEGPIRIAPYQADIIRECLKRKPDGHFKYSTILWSETKKSGKTTLAAGVLTWMGATTRNAECYCVANDGKQSKDRIYAKIRKAAELSQKLGGALAKTNITRDRMTFRHGSYIEAIACDPSGEAGGEPTATVFSELHGMKQEHKRRLWAEMTIPPTRWGRAIRWAESYAGYSGEDSILEQLYENIVEGGERHPDFPDLPIYIKGSNIAFWSHVGRQVWHTSEYYAAEADVLMPNEFRRMHKNEWVSTEASFVPLEWWNACAGEVPPIGDSPLIVAADAAVSGDTFTIIAVSRHPDESKMDDHVAVRYVQTWKPVKGQKLDYQGTEDFPGPERVIRWLIDNYNVVQFCYDPYQLHDMATRIQREGLVWVKEFSQGNERLAADTQLRQLIMHKRVLHDGKSRELNTHIANAVVKTDNEEHKLRIVKSSLSRHVDGAVALSMGAYRCLYLNVE